ncbi:MAG: sensor histidine kinase, partial [Planctomycetota bacterium]
AVGAAAFVPSLVVHMLLILRSHHERLTGWIRALRLIIYLPLPTLVVLALSRPDRIEPALGAFFFVLLGVGAGLSLHLGGLASGRAAAHAGTTRFYRYLACILVATAFAIGALASGWAPRRSPAVTASFLVEAMLVTVSVLPTSLLAYGVYRFYAIRPVLRRGFVNLTLAAMVVSIYVFVLLRLGRELDVAYGVSPVVVQAVGLLLLVASFHPFRRRVLDTLAWAIDPAGQKEQELMHSLVDDLQGWEAFSLSELAARVAHRMRDALGLERAAVALLPLRPDDPMPASPPGWLPYRELLEAIAALPARPFVRRAEIQDVDLSRRLADERVDVLRPLRYDGQLLGLVALGHTHAGAALEPRELEAVQRVSGSIAAAAAGARFFDEKITLERRLREEERLAALGRLAATIAHRVKNPLASIKAIAQAMHEDLDAADRHREDLEIVVSEVDRLTAVVSQLLGFARGGTRERAPLSVKDLAEDTIQLMQHQAAARQLSIAFACEPELPLVLGEATGLREVIANLLENAILASPLGGEVSVALTEGDGAVHVTVEDQGEGISEELEPRIFEPFFTTRVDGTGLGLSVSRRRVEALGGTLTLEPASSGGACFRITLERAAENESEAAGVYDAQAPPLEDDGGDAVDAESNPEGEPDS